MDQTQEAIQVQALRDLTKQIPLNDFHLPVGIYRTDLLPFHDYEPTGGNGKTAPEGEGEMESVGSKGPQELVLRNVDEIEYPAVKEHRIAGFPAKPLENAFVWLQYDEGFPAFEDGQPFWGRLEFEPNDAFATFVRYLHMHRGRKANREDQDDGGEAATGVRSVAQLAASFNSGSDVELLNIQEQYKIYYHLYYWGLRAKAYDLFKVAQLQKQQELRAIETNDEHYVMSKRLRNRLMSYIDGQEDFWDMMTPKIGVDMLKVITQLERVSAGMPAAGPATGEGSRSLELTLRQVAASSGETGTTVSEEGEVLDRALKDPKAVEILQELIIRSD